MINVPMANCCLPSTYQQPGSEEDLQQVALALKALAEPMRLQIVSIIAAGRGEAVCACVFPEALGIAQPTVSHHLKRLTDAGLISREQRGKWAWFALEPACYERVRTFLDPLLSREIALATSE